MVPLIVIVGADKGGVGKTTISRALLDYFTERGISCRAFDTESGNPEGVLKRFFPESTQIVDLATSDGQMAVLDTLGSCPVTVIDIRATLLSPTLKVLEELGFFANVREGKIKIAVLHVIGSTVASFSEIASTAAALTLAKHYVVTNHTNDASFFAAIGGVPKEALKVATVIDIPKLNERATEFVEAAGMPFRKFAADEAQSRTMRGYVSHWLGKVFEQLDIARLTQ